MAKWAEPWPQYWSSEDDEDDDGWMPIESAPRDGSDFLAFDGDFIEVCKFVDGKLLLSWSGDPFSTSSNIDCDATHWQPLPAPPRK